MSIYRCHVPTKIEILREFQSVKNKALSKRLLYIVTPAPPICRCMYDKTSIQPGVRKYSHFYERLLRTRPPCLTKYETSEIDAKIMNYFINTLRRNNNLTKLLCSNDILPYYKIKM